MKHRWITGFLGVSLVAVVGFVAWRGKNQKPSLVDLNKLDNIDEIRSAFSPENDDDAESRLSFDLARLQDPATGKIPKDIRTKELAFAKQLPTSRDLQLQGLGKSVVANWALRGPNNVGGRTRALAIDLGYNGSTNQKILAGGASGGVYISNNSGASWTRTTSNSHISSITAMAQDPNNTGVWYYGTGEVLGNSAGWPSGDFLGEGIFKSTDGGNSWSQLPSTVGGSATTFDSIFDFVWNLAVHPQTGDIYAAVIGAVARSSDGGNSWINLLVGQDAQQRLSYMTDVAVAANGDVYGTLSKNGIGLSAGEFGVFRIPGGGNQTQNISPPGLAADPYRMVLGAAPSDANTLYLLVQSNGSGATAQDHQFFRLNAETGTWADLSARLPNEQGAEGNSSFSSQGGYDLIVKVKPDNPDVVWIGGTNLYRSSDGGQSFVRVGGYANSQGYEFYSNHHSDQHSIAFFPNNANAMISGHDGGLSKSTNVLAQNHSWTPLNNGYVTSQFYGIAIDPQAGNDAFIVGGLQDNGSWGTQSTDTQTDWFNLLSGDGGFAAVAPRAKTFYVSAQEGFVVRYQNSNGRFIGAVVSPVAQDFQFIAPYVLDPNNANVMYIAAGNAVWRNSDLTAIPNGNNENTTINWTKLTNSAVPNAVVTAVAAAKMPANTVYFGATDFFSTTRIIRVDNVQSNPAGTDITPLGITAGSYPACIASSPDNPNEVMVVFSNYKVPSIWYSTNGGSSWTNVEGNLAGPNGPSVRWAVFSSSRGYYLATSIGVYSASSLNGGSTTWVAEGADVIGNVAVDMLAFRPEDGFLVAGTHGRGAYSVKVSGGNTTSVDNQSKPVDFVLAQNYPNPFNPETTIHYSLISASHIELEIFDLKGKKVRQLVNKHLPAGEHRALWNGTDANGLAVASGVYVYRLQIKGGDGTVRALSRKMTLLK